MRKILIRLAALLMPLPVLAAPQAPGNPSNVDLAVALCDSPESSADQTIAGCSALIKAGVMSGTDLSDTYNNRADGYLAKKQYDLAIADENKASAQPAQEKMPRRFS